MGRCLDPKHCGLQHISHICQLWVAPREVAHMSGREDCSSLTLQTLVLCTSGPTQKALTGNYSSLEIGEKLICHTCPLCLVLQLTSTFSGFLTVFLLVIWKKNLIFYTTDVLSGPLFHLFSQFSISLFLFLHCFSLSFAFFFHASLCLCLCTSPCRWVQSGPI